MWALQVGLWEARQGGLGQCVLIVPSDPCSLDDIVRKNFARRLDERLRNRDGARFYGGPSLFERRNKDVNFLRYAHVMSQENVDALRNCRTAGNAPGKRLDRRLWV
jgi:hypothetical protein